jgi:hypothetical protein
MDIFVHCNQNAYFFLGRKDRDDTDATQSSSSESLKDSCENFSMTHMTTPVQSPNPSILIKSMKIPPTPITPPRKPIHAYP